MRASDLYPKQNNQISGNLFIPNYSGMQDEIRKDKDVRIKFNFDGGLMIKLINKTGSASVKGSVVACSTGTDNAFHLQNNEFDSIGAVYESGIADGQLCWVVISGIADVLWKNDTAATRGRVALAADTDGRAIDVAVPTANPVVAEHFKEIGHVLETKSAGTNVLVKCVLHFN
jgi:hypothetical protein